MMTTHFVHAVAARTHSNAKFKVKVKPLKCSGNFKARNNTQNSTMNHFYEHRHAGFNWFNLQIEIIKYF